MRYFGSAIADSMFPETCTIQKAGITEEGIKIFFSAGFTSVVNPQHKATLDAAKIRYGLEIPIPPKAPIVKLEFDDQVLVMSVRGLPRLEENRHEYTAEEIARATFTFSHYEVID